MNEKLLNMTRGDTLAFAFEIEGLDQDLDTAFFSWKKDYNDESTVLQKSLENGISKVETGIYRVHVDPEDTEDLPLGLYYYDLEIGVNNDVFTIMKGQIELEWDITRQTT